MHRSRFFRKGFAARAGWRRYLCPMDFGRLPDLRYVDFRLPPDHPDTARVLARARPTQPALAGLHVGCPIWTN